MFDRVKAIKLYKEMLVDLEEIKEARIFLGNYDGIDLGSVIVSKDRTNSRLSSFLAKKAEEDGYNFFESLVQNEIDGSIATIFKIDNEPEEVRIKREEEISRMVAQMDEKTGIDRVEKQFENSDIVSLETYKRKLRN